jgi:hypothetical protein
MRAPDLMLRRVVLYLVGRFYEACARRALNRYIERPYDARGAARQCQGIARLDQQAGKIFLSIGLRR